MYGARDGDASVALVALFASVQRRVRHAAFGFLLTEVEHVPRTLQRFQEASVVVATRIISTTKKILVHVNDRTSRCLLTVVRDLLDSLFFLLSSVPYFPFVSYDSIFLPAHRPDRRATKIVLYRSSFGRNFYPDHPPLIDFPQRKILNSLWKHIFSRIWYSRKSPLNTQRE